MTINERIKTLRMQKGWSQKHLSELMNVSVSTIQLYEYGKIKPRYEQIIKLSDLFGEPIIPLKGVIHIPLDITTVSTKDLLKELERRCSK